MDKDFDTMYDERSYRADSEHEDEAGEELDEYGQPVYVPPWEMEW